MEKEFNDLFKLVSKHQFSFIYTKNENESNSINYEMLPTKQIVVNISNQKDENLKKLFEEKIKELEDRLK